MKPKIFIRGEESAFPNYQAAVELAGGEVVFSSTIDLDCDGLLLPGGGDIAPHFYHQENNGSHGANPVLDEEEIEVALAFIDAKKPILGICRGLQILTVALGGSLKQHIEGHQAVDGIDTIHNCFAAGMMVRLYGPQFGINSAHHQCVDTLPDCCRLLQISHDGVVEGFYHKELPIMAVQWHPERLCGGFYRPEAVDGLRLFQYFISNCVQAGQVIYD